MVKQMVRQKGKLKTDQMPHLETLRAIPMEIKKPTVKDWAILTVIPKNSLMDFRKVKMMDSKRPMDSVKKIPKDFLMDLNLQKGLKTDSRSEKSLDFQTEKHWDSPMDSRRQKDLTKEIRSVTSTEKLMVIRSDLLMVIYWHSETDWATPKGISMD